MIHESLDCAISNMFADNNQSTESTDVGRS